MRSASPLSRRHALALAAAGAGSVLLAPSSATPSAASPTAAPAEVAQGEAVPPRDLAFTEVAPGVFVYRAPYELLTPENGGAISNSTLVVGTQSAALIDTGNSFLAGTWLRAAVRRLTDRPLSHVINTHMHPDHTLGNAAFAADGVRFVGHHKLPRALSQRSETYLEQVRRVLGAAGEGTQLILPDLLVESRLTIDLGGRTLELTAQPTAHTDNDLVIRDSATGALILGDLLFSGHVPTLDGNLGGWLEVLAALAAQPAALAIPGHGPARLAWPEGATDERRYLEVLRADVRRLVAEGVPMGRAAEEAGLSERGRWALFAEFNARNAIAAYHEIEWE